MNYFTQIFSKINLLQIKIAPVGEKKAIIFHHFFQGNVYLNFSNAVNKIKMKN